MSTEVPVNTVDNTYHGAGSEVLEGDKKALSTVAFICSLVRTVKAKASKLTEVMDDKFNH